MRTLYHEFESLEHLLATRLLPGGGEQPIRFVVFGGTGAVGGAAVLQLCRLILLSKRYRTRPLSGEIHATGMSEKEITKFASRLYLALGETVTIEKLEPRRHYRIDGRIDLHFSILQLALPRDLREHVALVRRSEGSQLSLEQIVSDYFDQQPRPFLRFVEGLGAGLLHAVAVAIPLPSVATYTLEILDSLIAEEGLDHRTQQRIKSAFLRNFIRGLAIIQQRHARYVVIAHTTAVGGMYRVDGGTPEIRLGFAHSALGKKLVDKKYFADELTNLYLDHGFDVLITAAAIGIDAVDFHCRLPLDRAVRGALAKRAAGAEKPAIPAAELESPEILLYPALAIDFEPGAEPGGEPEAGPTALDFGAGKELTVDAAIRSGENGLFSVANCMALYNVMKVAIPEELAMVVVRHSVFGPERRHDWFRDKISYYAETENSHFALRLLESYPQLVRAHLGAFAPQAYQALGSATHQARLHELGLVMLLLRLRDFGTKLAELPEEPLLEALGDLDGFFWRTTRLPCFEDLETLDAAALSQLLGKLCEIDSKEAMGSLLGYEVRRRGVRGGGHEKFLARLATAVRRYVSTITSLGIPILYRSPSTGRDRLLVGPYVAPIDEAIATSDDVTRNFRRVADRHGIPYEVIRDWVVANNGFIDLRPHAIVSAAKEAGTPLLEAVRTFGSGEQVLAWIDSLPAGAYFTTVGAVALKLRLERLYSQLRRRKIELGTLETWKHLFLQDPEGRHVLAPGLVETVRMYTEGLGKITGTEALWPEWGY